ncbi:MAG TPA: phage portal protein [Candidatus Glassbacteria bacterium]|nr:phage portal protein [Candidatus Glassbacteria bacterium]
MERKSASIFSNCPWESGSQSVLQPLGKRPSGPYNQANTIQKQEGTSVVTAFEETRDGLPKAYIPNFFYRAPFGYPRYKDLNYFRQLATSIYVDMCTTAIIDEVCSVEWEIVAEDRAGNEIPGKEKDIERIQEFFYNPNTNKESWETIIRMMLPDLLEINSGIITKVFNIFGEMVEIYSRDGMAFTKNPDPYGTYTSRADLILMKNILGEGETQTQQMDYPAIQAEMTATDAHEEGAYFQYGFNTGARPIPFGRREIVWFEKKVRTDNLYGRSSMEILAKTVQTLIYAVESQLEYFNDNSIPPGVLGLEGMTSADMKAFGQQWVQQQKVQDELGNWKHTNHKLPMVNTMPKFERLGFTNQELELIESQKWWSKLVWGAFGITATELGFTEDSSGAANQIVQTSVAKKRIIYPLLRLIEYHVNTEIIPEFGVEGVRYKYKIFDIDEETKKWGLYRMQTEADLKTINEVRNAEGLDDVEWGDKNAGERSPNQGTNINVGDPRQQDSDKINRDSQNTRDKMSGKPAKGDKPDDIKKAITTDSPNTLELGEEIGPEEKKLKKQITDLLKSNKEKVFDLLGSQGKDEPLMQIKSIDDLPVLIKKIFQIFSFKGIVDEVIGEKFNSGWDKSEKQINKNIPMNYKALEFLQNHTFENVKGMTEEIANDLKAELSRGIINGESIPKLKDRVSKVFNVGEVRAEVIAITEVGRAENQGKLLAMKGSGLDMKKQWLSAHDERTSDLCKHLDGQVVGLDEDFHYKDWSGQAPPSHPRCRSVLLFLDKEDEDSISSG